MYDAFNIKDSASPRQRLDSTAAKDKIRLAASRRSSSKVRRPSKKGHIPLQKDKIMSADGGNDGALPKSKDMKMHDDISTNIQSNIFLSQEKKEITKTTTGDKSDNAISAKTKSDTLGTHTKLGNLVSLEIVKHAKKSLKRNTSNKSLVDGDDDVFRHDHVKGMKSRKIYVNMSSTSSNDSDFLDSHDSRGELYRILQNNQKKQRARSEGKANNIKMQPNEDVSKNQESEFFLKFQSILNNGTKNRGEAQKRRALSMSEDNVDADVVAKDHCGSDTKTDYRKRSMTLPRVLISAQDQDRENKSSKDDNDYDTLSISYSDSDNLSTSNSKDDIDFGSIDIDKSSDDTQSNGENANSITMQSMPKSDQLTSVKVPPAILPKPKSKPKPKPKSKLLKNKRLSSESIKCGGGDNMETEKSTSEILHSTEESSNKQSSPKDNIEDHHNANLITQCSIISQNNNPLTQLSTAVTDHSVDKDKKEDKLCRYEAKHSSIQEMIDHNIGKLAKSMQGSLSDFQGGWIDMILHGLQQTREDEIALGNY